MSLDELQLHADWFPRSSHQYVGDKLHSQMSVARTHHYEGDKLHSDLSEMSNHHEVDNKLHNELLKCPKHNYEGVKLHKELSNIKNHEYLGNSLHSECSKQRAHDYLGQMNYSGHQNRSDWLLYQGHRYSGDWLGTSLELQTRFNKAAEQMKNLKSKPSDSELLELYALYKQATVGDCNIDKPGVLDMKGKAKWEAWNGKKGTSQNSAKEAYIQVAEKLQASYGH